jgi:molybdenum cofactor cytidylyltransferase
LTADLAIVLLAAGKASRFGTPKQLARLDGVSLVRRAALAALEVCPQLIVVTGAADAAVSAELAGLRLQRIHNPVWEDGMGGSIACAFAAWRDAGPAAALVCLCDQPRVGAPELRRLIAAHAVAPAAIVAADHGANLGPPCLFPRWSHAELAALAGPAGARVVLQRHAARVISVPLPEAALDIDTPADLARAAGGA